MEALSVWETVRTWFWQNVAENALNFLRRSSKIESGLKSDALRTTAEPIGDFSNIFFDMVTTQAQTLSRKLVTASFLTKSSLSAVS